MDPTGNSEDEEVQHEGIHKTTLAAMPHREHRPCDPTEALRFSRIQVRRVLAQHGTEFTR
jgi:hypothetical protein